mmetsp:Transcript_89195/g.160909  ORF Transcript_89195/g.160909 Transcript_89195/m.160909 type:complete len:242 (-) Transcript_89195:3778-4503(-)
MPKGCTRILCRAQEHEQRWQENQGVQQRQDCDRQNHHPELHEELQGARHQEDGTRGGGDSRTEQTLAHSCQGVFRPLEPLQPVLLLCVRRHHRLPQLSLVCLVPCHLSHGEPTAEIAALLCCLDLLPVGSHLFIHRRTLRWDPRRRRLLLGDGVDVKELLPFEIDVGSVIRVHHVKIEGKHVAKENNEANHVNGTKGPLEKPHHYEKQGHNCQHNAGHREERKHEVPCEGHGEDEPQHHRD